MATYLVKRDTWISHEGRKVTEGQTVTINWPKGAEPKRLGDNLELVDKKGEKKPDGENLA